MRWLMSANHLNEPPVLVFLEVCDVPQSLYRHAQHCASPQASLRIRSCVEPQGSARQRKTHYPMLYAPRLSAVRVSRSLDGVLCRQREADSDLLLLVMSVASNDDQQLGCIPSRVTMRFSSPCLVSSQKTAAASRCLILNDGPAFSSFTRERQGAGAQRREQE